MACMLPTTELALERRVAVEQADSRAPSLIAAVVRGTDLLWTGARGRVDGQRPTADTQYRIGSITKTFVAVLVLRLRDEGKLDLNDPLDKHVPGTSLGHLTVAQLLAHTGGLTPESPGGWGGRAGGAAWPGAARPHPQPPHALGWAVHPYADVLLNEPTPDAGAMAPAGQLWSTVTDLARWTRFLAGDTGQVLHPDTVAEMREPAHVDDGDAWVAGY